MLSQWESPACKLQNDLFGEAHNTIKSECDQDLVEYVGHGSFQDMIEAGATIVINPANAFCAADFPFEFRSNMQTVWNRKKVAMASKRPVEAYKPCQRILRSRHPV